MNPVEKLSEIVAGLESPRFKDERQAIRLMDELLEIHMEAVSGKTLHRKLRRRIKRLWEYGLPYDLYQQLNLHGLEANQVRVICEA